MQDAILNNLGRLDLSLITDKYKGEIVPYIYRELIEPISELKDPAQKAIQKLFEIEPEKISATEYMNQMRKQLEEAFPNDIGSQRKWSELLGVENIRDEISAARNAITTEFTDQTGHIKLSQDQIGELYGLSLEDLRIYSDLVKDGVYDTWDDL